MKLATEIGFAPPVLVSSTLYKCEDKQLTSMLGKNTEAISASRRVLHCVLN